jgi:1-acyl-sn-glycerol-3-phosphate acyltransferase
VTFNAVKQLFYGLYLTNSFGFRLRNVKDPMEIKRLRLGYSQAQLDTLNITVKIENREKLPKDGQYLVLINHRGIIDPPITEVTLKDTRYSDPGSQKKSFITHFSLDCLSVMADLYF